MRPLVAVDREQLVVRLVVLAPVRRSLPQVRAVWEAARELVRVRAAVVVDRVVLTAPVALAREAGPKAVEEVVAEMVVVQDFSPMTMPTDAAAMVVAAHLPTAMVQAALAARR